MLICLAIPAEANSEILRGKRNTSNEEIPNLLTIIRSIIKSRMIKRENNNKVNEFMKKNYDNITTGVVAFSIGAGLTAITIILTIIGISIYHFKGKRRKTGG